MARLDLDLVRVLSLVDEPEVGDAQFLVTKRHDADTDASGRVEGDGTPTEDEQQPADPGGDGSGRDAGGDDSIPMEPEELDERLEEHREETIEAATDAVSEVVEKRFDELETEPEEEPEADPEPEYPTAEEIAKAMHELGDEADDPEGGEVEVSEERAKEIKAVVKGMEGDGRKGRATQTDTDSGERDYSESFVADAVSGGGD